jgi:hypothetical protein
MINIGLVAALAAAAGSTSTGPAVTATRATLPAAVIAKTTPVIIVTKPAAWATKAAAPPGIFFRTGNIDLDIPAAKVVAFEHADGFFGFCLGCHLNECKPLGFIGEAVHDDFSGFDCSGLCEQGAELIISCGESEVPYVKFYTHFLIYPWSSGCKCRKKIICRIFNAG